MSKLLTTKAYSNDGAFDDGFDDGFEIESLLKTWHDIADLPSFEWSINGGLKNQTIHLPRNFGTIGEVGDVTRDGDVGLGNRLEQTIYDTQTPSPAGLMLYDGIIDDYTVRLDGSPVSLTILSPDTYFQDGVLVGEDAITFTDTDPTSMAQYFVNNYMPGITWLGSNPLVGQLFTETFGADEKLGQIFDKIQKMAGGRWYYTIDASKQFKFNYWDPSSAPTHKLIIGVHVSADVEFNKSRMDYHQRIIVTGAVGIRAVYVQPGYAPSIEPRDLKYSNNRITDISTAQRIANALGEYYGEVFYETKIPVIDNTEDATKGYDIESFHPGDTVSLINPDYGYQPRIWGDTHTWGDGGTWGGTEFESAGQSLVIASINYHFTDCILTLRNKGNSVASELVNLGDRLLIGDL